MALHCYSRYIVLRAFDVLLLCCGVVCLLCYIGLVSFELSSLFDVACCVVL